MLVNYWKISLSWNSKKKKIAFWRLIILLVYFLFCSCWSFDISQELCCLVLFIRLHRSMHLLNFQKNTPLNRVMLWFTLGEQNLQAILCTLWMHGGLLFGAWNQLFGVWALCHIIFQDKKLYSMSSLSLSPTRRYFQDCIRLDTCQF